MKKYSFLFVLIFAIVFGQKRNAQKHFVSKNQTINFTGLKTNAVGATVPRLVSYQGLLSKSDGSPISDGNYEIKFRLFSSLEGGDPVWVETQMVSLQNGILSAILGKTEEFEFIPETAYLDLTVDGVALSPRIQMTSVLYSILSDTSSFARTANYDDLNNLPDLEGTYQKIDTSLTDLVEDGVLSSDKVEFGITSVGDSGQTWISDGVGSGAWGRPSEITADNIISGSGDIDLITSQGDVNIVPGSWAGASIILDSTIILKGSNLGHINNPDLMDLGQDTIKVDGTIIANSFGGTHDDLEAISNLEQGDGNFIVSDGSTWTVESDSLARSSLGLGSMALQDSGSINIGTGNFTDINVGSVSIGSEVITSSTNRISFNDEDLITSGSVLAGASTFGSDSYIGTLNLKDGSITDFNGAISFEDENLSTTGDLTVGSTNISSGVINDTSGTISFGDEDIATSGTLTVGNTILSDGIITSSTGAISFEDEDITTTGSLNAGTTTLSSGSTIGNLTLADGSFTSASGSISFGDENLTTTGRINTGVATMSPGSSVGNITISDGSIASSSDTINFGNDNLTTSGSITATTFVGDGASLTGINATIVDTLIGNAPIVLEGSSINDFETTLNAIDPTEDRTISLPNESGTVLTTGSGVSDAYVANNLTINNGTIDASPIGSNSTSSGAFTNLSGTEVIASTNINITGSGGLILENDETITNSSDGNILITADSTSISGDLTVQGNDISFGNEEKISNELDGTVSVTADSFSLSGDLKIAGNDILFGNQESISNGVDGTIQFAVDGNSQLSFADGAVVPETDDDIDLGTSAKKFKNLYINGTAYADQADIEGGSIDGVSLGSNTAISEATVDFVKIDGTYIGHINDEDLITLGAGEVTVTGDVNATQFFGDGSNLTGIEATTIGTLTGAEPLILEGDTDDSYETTLAVTDPTSDRTITFPNESGTVLLTNTSGSINTTPIGDSSPSTGAFTTLSASGNVDLNSGAIDGTTIGASSASTGAFTTLSGTEITASSKVDITGAAGLILENDETITNTTDGTILINANTTSLSGDLGVTGNIAGTEITASSKVDITGSGGLILENDETISNSIDGTVLINGIIKGGTGSADGIFSSNGDNDVILKTGNSTTGSITIADGPNGNIAILPQGSGEVDITKVDINSGTIDDLIVGTSLSIGDDDSIILGTDSDITLKYDEANNNALEIFANRDGADLGIILKSDEGDDPGDAWKLNVADNGVLSFGNDKNDADTYVSHLTVTPNSTSSNSTVAVAGNLTAGGNLTVTGVANLDVLELGSDNITLPTSDGSANQVLKTNGSGTLSWTNVTANSIGTLSGGTPLVFEGASADENEISIAVTDPTDDRTITFPNTSGTLITTGNATDLTLMIEGTTDDAYETTLAAVDPTADRTITFPNVDGTVITTGNSTSLTSATNLSSVGTITTGTWNATSISDGKIDNDLTISGGTINNSAIGASSASTGAFTTITASTSLDVTGSSGIILENDETITNSDNGSVIINGVVKAGTGSEAGVFSSNSDHDLVLQTGNSTTGAITITDGANGNIAITPNGTGEVDISKVDIDSGTIDAVALGTVSAVTKAVVDNISIDNATIGHTSDADLLTFANGIVTVDGAIISGDVKPSTSNSNDLGTSSEQYKDLYIDGVAYADALGFGTVAMTLPTSDGSSSQILQTNGSGSLSWTDVNANSVGVLTGSTPLIFEGDTGDDYETTLTITDPTADRTLTVPDESGTIVLNVNGTAKTGTGSGAGVFSSEGNYDVTLQTGNSTTGSITITDGSNGNIAITPNGTGEVDISKVDIDGGAVDGTVIGANSAAAGTFTTLNGASIFASTSVDVTGSAGVILENDETITNSTDGTVVINGIVKGGTGSAAGVFTSSGDQDLTLQTGNSTTGSITITDGSNGNIAITPNGTGEVDISKVDIDGGAVDGTVIGANSAAAGTFSGITGPIGASSASTGAFTTLSASGAGDLNGDVNLSGTVSLDGSANELRFYEGGNYVGFEAPSLSADKIWVLPGSDGSSNQVLQTNGSGTLSWATITATSVGTLSGGTPLVFEGATADAYETSFAITDPSSSDKTITFPDATGTVITTGNSGSLTSAANLATVGSVTSGTWRATAIANDKVDDDLTISGGSVNGSPIGSSSASSGAFTTITASTSLDVTGSTGIILENDETITNANDGTVLITATTTKVSGDLTVTGNDIVFDNNESISNQTDGTVIINGIVKGGTGSAAGVFSSNGDQDLTLQTGNSTTGSITITDGSNGNIAITPNGSGSVVVSKADINSGAIDGTAIGAGTPSTGAFSTLSASGNVDLNAGAIDGTTIGASSASTGAFTTLSASSTGDLNSTVNISGTVSLDGSANELRFYEGANYVGFEAPSLSADKIWVLPDSDGSSNQVLKTDGSGNLSWTAVSATQTTVSDNESTSENNLITFVADAGTSTGAHALEMDGDLYYTPSTGALTATGGAFATVTASTSLDVTGSAGVILENDETITNSSNGTVVIDGILKVGTGSAAGQFVSNGNQDVTLKTGNGTTGSITIANGSNGDISVTPNGSGSVVVSKADINSGAIDGTAIGAGTPSTGAFTTLSASGNVDLNSGAIDGTAIGASSASTGAFSTLSASGNVDLNAGAIDGTTIGASSASTGAFTTITASTSLDVTGSVGVILENDETITNSSNGTVIINGIVKGGTGSAAGVFASNGDQDLTLQTGNSTTGSITITDGSNGNIAITPNGTGEVDISKVDIDAGAIDGTVIGATSAAAGTFSSLDLGDNNNLILGDNDDVIITYDESTNDAMEIKAAVDGTALKIILKTDRGDDAGDEWKLNVAPTNGVLTLGNDLNSAGTYVTHLTVTPNATASNSTVAVAGNATVGNDLTITGNDITFGNDETISNASDGTVAITATTTSVSGDLTVTGNDITFGNTETISNQTNGEVVINGILKAGTGSAAGVFASNGDNDVTLKTGNSATGEITIIDGSNGNIAITPDGTGEVDISKVDIAGGEIDAVTLGANSAVTQAIVDNILIDGNVIGRNDVDQDLITLTNGVVTVAGRVAATTLTGDGSGLTAVPAASISTLAGQDPIVFEGATDNTEETTLRIADPSADRIVTIPDATGTIVTTGNLSVITTTGTVTSGVWSGTALVDAKVDNDLTISGGTVNSSVIGGSSAAAGTFTTLTANTKVVIGSADIVEAELEMIDGITAGTAAASKALVVDSDKDIETIRNLTIDGVLTDGNYTFDTNGNVSGLGAVSSGAITSSGKLLLNSGEDLGNGGSADHTKVASYFTTTGAETGNLTAGASGQIKTLMMVGDGGNMVITVTNPAWGGSGTITFDDVGDGVILQYINSKWFAVGSNGVTFG